MYYNAKSLNIFLDYLKKYAIPNHKYLSSDRWFKIYEITKDSIYANKFYITDELESFFKSIGIR